MAEESYKLWLCAKCEQWAEQELGETCEVCEEGVIEEREVVPKARLTAARDKIELARELLERRPVSLLVHPLNFYRAKVERALAILSKDDGGERVEVVPKARLAEVERELAEAREAITFKDKQVWTQSVLREKAEQERDERGHALAQERVELALEAGRLAKERALREKAEQERDERGHALAPQVRRALTDRLAKERALREKAEQERDEVQEAWRRVADNIEDTCDQHGIPREDGGLGKRLSITLRVALLGREAAHADELAADLWERGARPEYTPALAHHHERRLAATEGAE